MSNHTILIIDDEAAQRSALAGFLKKQGHQILMAASGPEGLEQLKSQAVDLILTDFKMPGMSGLELLSQAKALNPEVDVIVMTAFGTIEGATQALKRGAVDYLAKPIDLDELEIIVQKALERRMLVSENKQLRQQLASKYQFKEIISTSSAMEEVLNVVARAAASKATVLIVGESGTGKELIARALHAASPRADRPFVPMNVAAMAENLLESELFGHEKGAFTGADRLRKGRFEIAHTGTLFIDEVGEIPMPTQVKLLRVLQEQRFERVGGFEPLQVDVRLVAATNRNLEQMIKDGRFREDLYYRLNVVRINLPPLRQRKTDIPVLTHYFVKKYAEENGKKVLGISKEAMDRLVKYDYPGNIRELQNLIEQAVVLTRDERITLADLPATVGRDSNGSSSRATSAGSTFIDKVEAFEKQLIQEALQLAEGVQTRAARILGITERHLRYKLQKYALK